MSISECALDSRDFAQDAHITRPVLGGFPIDAVNVAQAREDGGGLLTYVVQDESAEVVGIFLGDEALPAALAGVGGEAARLVLGDGLRGGLALELDELRAREVRAAHAHGGVGEEGGALLGGAAVVGDEAHVHAGARAPPRAREERELHRQLAPPARRLHPAVDVEARLRAAQPPAARPQRPPVLTEPMHRGARHRRFRFQHLIPAFHHHRPLNEYPLRE